MRQARAGVWTVALGTIVVAPISHAQPTARNSHVMASGPDGAPLMFGGGSGPGVRLVDTLWRWNGAEWSPLSSDGPRARLMAAAAYDSRRRVLVLYGGAGIGSGTKYGDTWEWDGHTWTERSVRGPGPRDHHAMAFDEARGETILVGGNGSTGTTWAWNGTAWRLADSLTGPPPLAHHAMAYDRIRRRVVLYGGFPATGGPRSADTWEWDGARWTRATTSRSPGARSHHRMAFDAARGAIVLFGGGDSTSTETWTYDGSDWLRHAVAGPPPRWSSAMAFDAARARVVLFGGGLNRPPYGSLGDTWEWNGSAWVAAVRVPSDDRRVEFLGERQHSRLQTVRRSSLRSRRLLGPHGSIAPDSPPTSFHNASLRCCRSRRARSQWRQLGAGFAGHATTAARCAVRTR